MFPEMAGFVSACLGGAFCLRFIVQGVASVFAYMFAMGRAV